MDRSSADPDHAGAVAAWLARSSGQSSSAEILRLFHTATEDVWNRAVTTLGTVTLTAIAERVLFKATDRFAFLATINPRPNGDTRWREVLHERLVSVPRNELIEGLTFGLTELLTVIGRLTAEILTEELHAALGGGVAAPSDKKPQTSPPPMPKLVVTKVPS